MKFNVSFRLDSDKTVQGVGTLTVTTNPESVDENYLANWNFTRRVDFGATKKAELLQEILSDFNAWADRRKVEVVLESALKAKLETARDAKFPEMAAARAAASNKLSS